MARQRKRSHAYRMRRLSRKLRKVMQGAAPWHNTPADAERLRSLIHNKWGL